MGITIDVDMYLLCSMFNISPKKITDEYSGMTIEEIMEAEAKQGNTEAANFDSSVLNDPAKLIELFELKDPGNKYAILSNMNEDDLDNLLPMLKPEDLIQGLNFFTEDKLLSMVGELPKGQLVNLTFQMFSPEQFMQLMPDEQMNKVLSSTDMQQNKGLELKYLQNVNPQVLAQMIEASTGQQAAGVSDPGLDGQQTFDQKALLDQITNLNDDKFQDALLCMPKASKQKFMLQMTQDDPKIFQLFSPDAFTDVIANKKQKSDVIRSANVIEPDQLVGMVQQLPQNLTAVVLTQMDTKKFADVLIGNFKNILSQIVAG